MRRHVLASGVQLARTAVIWSEKLERSTTLLDLLVVGVAKHRGSADAARIMRTALHYAEREDTNPHRYGYRFVGPEKKSHFIHVARLMRIRSRRAHVLQQTDAAFLQRNRGIRARLAGGCTRVAQDEEIRSAHEPGGSARGNAAWTMSSRFEEDTGGGPLRRSDR